MLMTGTSPLYVLNGIWPASGDMPSEEDIIGGISAIIWSLLLIPLIKYVRSSSPRNHHKTDLGIQVAFALQFGSLEGEGGPFALFMNLFPRHDASDDGYGRSLTQYPELPSNTRSPSRSSTWSKFRWPLMAWAIFGAALTMSDGILT